MIRFNNVTYHYQQQEFRFDHEILTASLVAVLGTSGAGKSTLLNLAAGFIAPLTGNIEIAGESVADIQPHQRPLSMLFQEQNLFAHLSVQDNIGIGLHPGLRLTPAQQMRVDTVAKQLSIDHLLSRFPEQLSGGQKQRVALARCFAQDKPLLLLDEPFSALDPVLRAQMLAIVKRLASINNVTVLMVTHHLADAFSVATHYLFIEAGKICSAGEISQLNANSENLAVRKFVQASL